MPCPHDGDKHQCAERDQPGQQKLLDLGLHPEPLGDKPVGEYGHNQYPYEPVADPSHQWPPLLLSLVITGQLHLAAKLVTAQWDQELEGVLQPGPGNGAQCRPGEPVYRLPAQEVIVYR